jgi:acyl-homoserine lactone acylase PvdQ
VKGHGNGDADGDAGVGQRHGSGPAATGQEERADAEKGGCQKRPGRVVHAERRATPPVRGSPRERACGYGVRGEGRAPGGQLRSPLRPKPASEAGGEAKGHERRSEGEERVHGVTVDTSGVDMRDQNRMAMRIAVGRDLVDSCTLRAVRRPVAAVLVSVAAALAFALAPLEAAAPKKDYASTALTILPPGENGSLAFDRNTTDQAKLYDALTPLQGNVSDRAMRRLFKPAPLGASSSLKRERPRVGVTIGRDRFGVAHVTGKTQADVAFGAGWVTAADRGLLLQLIRGPARIAALDVPRLDPLSLALSGKTFVPSAETEAFLANQLDALRAQGTLGRKALVIVNAYAAGVNAWYRAKGIPVDPFTNRDVVAAAALIAARFGANGGQEVANSMFLDALQNRFGATDARSVFADLREGNDPDAPVTVPTSFPYELPSDRSSGSVVIDDGSFTGAPLAQSAFASSALLVGAKRSKTGHPLFVAGPQVGYFFPEFFAEMELQGGGFATRGAVFPGVPFVVIGRGPDYAWSATSSQADNTDLFVETLCGNDDRHYEYRGQCLPMQRFFAGTLKSPGAADQQVAYLQTTHGPVVGYATVKGRKVAISLQRSTRGREILSFRPFYELDTGAVTSAQSFLEAMSGVEFSFNWFYADEKDIAFFSSGRLPERAPGTDPALPTLGTGDFDWRSYLLYVQHARGIDPKSGLILNWNNKPAENVGAADSNFSYGSVQRVDLLRTAMAGQQKFTLPGLVSAMNKAATQDLRVVRVWPLIRAVLDTGPAPSARAEAAAGLVDQWLAAGGSRLDLNGDGRIDAAGAAVLDAAWPTISTAVFEPVLGPLVPRLAALQGWSDDANPQGSAYISGWYGYVDKDLRTLLGRPVRAPYSRRYCGAGVLQTCRESLWAAIDAAAAELEASQGPAPSTWRSDATSERIRFVSGVLPDTMRWTNRSTFQQVMSFSGHRPRRR